MKTGRTVMGVVELVGEVGAEEVEDDAVVVVEGEMDTTLDRREEAAELVPDPGMATPSAREALRAANERRVMDGERIVLLSRRSLY